MKIDRSRSGLALALVALLGCSAGQDDGAGRVQLTLESGSVEYRSVRVEEVRAAPGQPVLAARLVARPLDPEAAAYNGMVVTLPGLDPGSWSHDGSRSGAALGDEHPRIELRHDGRAYRCYPGLASVASVRCEVTVRSRTDRVEGILSARLAAVDGSLEPTGATLLVSDGWFDVAAPSRANRDQQDSAR